MVTEGTFGKWSLWATHPNRVRPIAETYATTSAAAVRAAGLRAAGYVVDVFLANLKSTD